VVAVRQLAGPPESNVVKCAAFHRENQWRLSHRARDPERTVHNLVAFYV